MKKTLSAIIFFSITCSAVHAQKNTLLAQGSTTFLSAKNNTSSGSYNYYSRSTQFSIEPLIGYQFSNNWTIGAAANFTSAKDQNGDDIQVISKTTGHNFVAGPFIRYTKSISDFFKIYGQLEAEFGSYKSTSVSNGIPSPITLTNKGSVGQVNLFPAVCLNIKNNFGLNFNFGGLSYSYNTPKNTDNSNYNKTTVVEFNFGKLINVGISKNFGGGEIKK